MTRKTKLIILNTIALMILFMVGVYVVSINSEQYKVAVNYIETNEMIRNELGEVKEVALDFFGHYETTGTKAEMEISVSSNNKEGKVFILLNRDLGEWHVVEAKLKNHKKARRGQILT